MSQFLKSFELSRGRFAAEVEPLSTEQLNWKLYPGSLSIGEMALHVAGVEAFFIRQLTDLQLDDDQKRIEGCATQGVVNDSAFPFTPEEITSEQVKSALAWTHGLVLPYITAPSDAFLSKELVSALGPVITGEGALARMAFHPGYHHGQAYQIKCAPGFPA